MFQIEKKHFEYKKEIFQSPKNRIFPKGLTHAFAQQMANCSSFGFGQNKTKKMLNNFVEKQETFF